MMRGLLSFAQTGMIVFMLLALSFLAHGIGTAHFSFYRFLLFDILWQTILFLMLFRPITFVYFFSSFFLFMGIWFKFIIHFAFQIPFIEPLGYGAYLHSPPWDRVLTVCIIIACALLSGYLLSFFLFSKKEKVSASSPPFWYKKHANSAWTFMLLFGVLLGVINFHFSFFTIAHTTKIILPFHWNAILIALLIFFLPCVFTIFTVWDFYLRASYSWGRLLLFMLLATFIALSTWSRSVYIFWTIPVFLCLYLCINQSIWHFLKKNFLLLLVYILITIFVTGAINLERRFFYWFPEATSVKASSHLTPVFYVSPLWKGSHRYLKRWLFSDFYGVVFGRWVGLEAIMATTTYPGQRNGLLRQTFSLHRPSPDDVSLYNHVILGFPVNSMASFLPGLIGILNYSNLLVYEFLGVLACLLLLLAVEYALYRFSCNPALMVIWGMYSTFYVLVSMALFYNIAMWIIELLFFVFFFSVIIANWK